LLVVTTSGTSSSGRSRSTTLITVGCSACRNGVLRSPPVDDVKDIGCIRLLIQVVVEASGLPPSGSDKFEQKPLHLRAVERLAAYLADDVAFV
jgi:hypothetical protein